ncbi:MAG: pantoate--beta-alanine ligase [Flavobacterium sp.]|jgi:pantoate--beta-alanine ligase|nr:pantoate--beta-alanine ligase [Flavobacterium sp.]
MLIFETQLALIEHLKVNFDSTTTIGFVPTMGALHQGHLSLIEISLQNNDLTIVSIFVNPTQFNNSEDLEKYPRNIERDIAKLQTLSDNVIIYAPSVYDIYKGNTTSKSFNFDGLENQMEGKFRPGHFNGVGTIVKRLFDIVNPTNAYFGEKDFQQLQIIKKLVEKEHLPINIVGCAIYREKNGLAMSSRNERLSPNERNDAAIIYQTLLEVQHKFLTEPLSEIEQWVNQVFENQHNFRLDYFDIADETTLITCKSKNTDQKYRAFIAVFVNNIRLIDTISLN